MGHFVGKNDQQAYVHDDGAVYTNSYMVHKLADTEHEFFTGEKLPSSLICIKMPDENGEVVYGKPLDTRKAVVITSLKKRRKR